MFEDLKDMVNLPVLIMDVQLSPGSDHTESLVLYERDSVAQVVKHFVDQHALSAEIEHSLLMMVRDRLNSLPQQLLGEYDATP